MNCPIRKYDLARHDGTTDYLIILWINDAWVVAEYCPSKKRRDSIWDHLSYIGIRPSSGYAIWKVDTDAPNFTDRHFEVILDDGIRSDIIVEAEYDFKERPDWFKIPN